MSMFRKVLLMLVAFVLTVPVVATAQIHPTTRLALFSLECDPDIVANLTVSQQFEHRLYTYVNACDGGLAGYYPGSPVGTARRPWQFPTDADGALLGETYTLTLHSVRSGASKQCSVANVAEMSCHVRTVPRAGLPIGASFHLVLD